MDTYTEYANKTASEILRYILIEEKLLENTDVE